MSFRRLLSLLLLAALACGALAACGNKGDLVRPGKEASAS